MASNEYFYLFGRVALAAGRFENGVTGKDVTRSLNDFAAVKGLGTIPEELRSEFDALATEAGNTGRNAQEDNEIAERIKCLYKRFKYIMDVAEMDD